jgi:c-di-GMP-binding flagellar brake protein YcgR
MELSQSELTLQIGDRLQLQKAPTDRPERYLVQVVGYLPGQSLIVTTPRINGKVAIVRPDQRYTVRVLQGSSVFGFVSSVLQAYSAPFPHLHLSYPKEMERIVVRNALRAVTDLHGVTRNTKHRDEGQYYREVRIVDLSNTGGRLVSKAPLGTEGEMLMVQFSVRVCGGQENLGLLGEIRSVGKRSPDGDNLGFWTGIQFQALNRFQQVLLQAYVLERLLGEKRA